MTIFCSILAISGLLSGWFGVGHFENKRIRQRWDQPAPAVPVPPPAPAPAPKQRSHIMERAIAGRLDPYTGQMVTTYERRELTDDDLLPSGYRLATANRPQPSMDCRCEQCKNWQRVGHNDTKIVAWGGDVVRTLGR